MPNIAVPTPPDAIFGLKFHQVAIYHHDPEQAVTFWRNMGFNKWIHDDVLLEGVEFGIPFTKGEEEWFNYDILPLELCYMRYTTDRFHANDPRDGRPPFIGHMATYVEDLDAEMERIYLELGLRPYKVYRSVQHQNPYLLERAITFYKCLYDTTRYLGFDVKLTQKVIGK